jgi:late competence protein required for DNA uptake (superfamily II DNA/RNA helicase)
MFTCERCGVDCSEDCFIVPNGKLLCPPCAMLKDNVDQKSLAAVTQAKTVQEKIAAWQNANGIL